MKQNISVGEAKQNNESGADESFTTRRSTEPSVLASFPCTHLHTPGRLILSLTEVRFEASFFRGSSDPVRFRCKYSDLKEITKRESHSKLLSPLAKLTSELDSLEIRVRMQDRETVGLEGWGDEPVLNTFVLENMIGRDKAFNSIIGFSGIRWQNLEG